MPVYKFGGNPEIEEEETNILERVDEQYVRLNGDNTFTGQLDMGGNRIVRIATPVENDDAVTKKYVDDVKAYGEMLTVSIHDSYTRDLREQAVKKIPAPKQRLLVSTEDGNVADSSLAVADVALKTDSKIASANGNMILMSDSDGNIVESNPIVYTSIKSISSRGSSSNESNYIRNLSEDTFSTLPLKAGTYRITTDCFFDNLSNDVKQMYLGAREKDAVAPNRRDNVMRWRAAVARVSGGGYIAQSSIVKFLRDMTDAIFLPSIDNAWTTPNTPWMCEFVIERIA